MEHIKIMFKLQSMKKCNANVFHSKISIFSLAALSLISLFFSSPLWLPSLHSSWKFLFYVFLPYSRALAFFFNPRYLFILCNIIITLLIRESKISNSGGKSSPLGEIYKEYLERSQSQIKIQEEKKLEKEVEQERDLNEVIISKKIVVADEEDEQADEEDEKGEDINEMNFEAEDLENEEEEDEETDLPDHEELRKRVEDFIARINQQRKLEARMLVACCA